VAQKVHGRWPALASQRQVMVICFLLATCQHTIYLQWYRSPDGCSVAIQGAMHTRKLGFWHVAMSMFHQDTCPWERAAA